MGTLYDMQAFFRFLEEATDSELVRRRDALRQVLGGLTEDDVIADAKFLLRKIEEEMLARGLRF